IALHAAGRDSYDRRENRQAESEQHRYPESVDEPRHDVSALIVGTEPVVLKIAATGEVLPLHHILALRLGEKPGRLRRRGRRQIEVVRIVRIANERPDDGAALRRDQFLQIGIAIIGGRLEISAKCGFGIGHKCRKVEMPVKLDKEWLVVRDQLRKHRNEEQNQKYPERPV